MPYLIFLKKQQNLKLSSAANYTIGGALRVKNQYDSANIGMVDIPKSVQKDT